MIERDWEFEKIKKYKENVLRENIYIFLSSQISNLFLS